MFPNNRSTSLSMPDVVASSSARRGLKTKSHPVASSAKCNRTTSRKRRRMRFRNTALPSPRGVVNPTREPFSAVASVVASVVAGPRTRKAVNSGDPKRRPVL